MKHITDLVGKPFWKGGLEETVQVSPTRNAISDLAGTLIVYALR